MSMLSDMKGLYLDALALVQAEGRLIQAEAAEKVNQAQRGVVLLGISLVLLLTASIVLVQSLIDWIATLIGEAPATLLVGCVLLVTGVIVFIIARKRLSADNLKPHRSLAAARRSVDIVREHAQ